MRYLTVLCFSLFVSPSIALSQSEWEPSCSSCQISLSLVLQFGSEEGQGFGADAPGIARAATRIFLKDRTDPDRIKVFGLRGSSKGTIGRDGEGPGEFREVVGIGVLRGDTLLALDRGLSRVSVFGPDLELVSSFSPRLRVEDESLTLLSDGTFLLTGNAPDRELVGIPHHVFDTSGRVLRSFGDPQVRGSPLGPDFYRPVSSGNSGTLWVAHQEEYRLTEWSLDGKKRRVLRPVRSWFDNHRMPVNKPDPDGLMPSPSFILKVSTTEDGLVWVLGRAPDPNWRESIGPDGQNNNHEKAFDSILEVYDPQAGELVASLRVEQGLIWGFSGPNEVFGTVYDNFVPTNAIWRVELTGYSPLREGGNR